MLTCLFAAYLHSGKRVHLLPFLLQLLCCCVLCALLPLLLLHLLGAAAIAVGNATGVISSFLDTPTGKGASGTQSVSACISSLNGPPRPYTTSSRREARPSVAVPSPTKTEDAGYQP